MTPEFFTVSEVAERLRCKPDLVRTLIRSGKLKAINITKGKRANYRISDEQIAAFIAESKVEAVEPVEPARRQFKPVIRKLKHLRL